MDEGWGSETQKSRHEKEVSDYKKVQDKYKDDAEMTAALGKTYPSTVASEREKQALRATGRLKEDTFKAKVTYKDWLSKNKLDHSPQNTEKYKKEMMKEAVDRRDTVTLDIPFIIRLLEYSREDAKSDMDLHKVVERLINIRKKGVLTMADYKTVTQNIREEVDLEENGLSVPGPTNVTGPQSGTDPVSATAVKPKKQPKTLFSIRRKQPKM